MIWEGVTLILLWGCVLYVIGAMVGWWTFLGLPVSMRP
jgi:hypothetical protein